MNKKLQQFLERSFRASRRDISFDKLVSSCTPFLESVNSGISLGIYLRLKYGEFSQYLTLNVDANDYLTADAFFFDYQSSKLFSKSEVFPRIFNTKKEAMKTFIEAELKCLEMNKNWIELNSPFIGKSVEYGIFHTATRKIHSILGPCPSIESLQFSFGPGNNVALHKNTSVHDKLSAKLTYTGNLSRFLPRIMSTCPSWVRARFHSEVPTRPGPYVSNIEVQRVYGSELGFVPKTAKTDRTICTEPLLNSFVQLGIGKYIRSRLRRAGCDTTDQTVNQRLSRQGSISGDLATIDLSSASDLISKAVVWNILPEPWYDLLNTCRSPSYTYEGSFYNLEKFSSMGNGYTFELETLIFLSLARATCEVLGISSESVSVYGDDIIVPTAAYEKLCSTLVCCGFSVNHAKSFSAGPFRESCGSDWFLGSSVRPLFLKRRPTNASLIGWCNHIKRLDKGRDDPRFSALYDGLKALVPRAYYNLVGPDGYGDGHFVEYDPALREKHKSRFYKRGWEGHAYYTLGSSPLHYVSCNDIAYPAALYGLPDDIFTTSDLFKVKSDSHQSLDGMLAFSRRKKTRTVLRRSFHPWKLGND